jgi:hypothetical protein
MNYISIFSDKITSSWLEHPGVCLGPQKSAIIITINHENKMSEHSEMFL